MAIQQVTDTNGVCYELGRSLGRGGQGAVYEIKGGRLAAKIISKTSPVKREPLRNQLAFVKRLALNDLALARPLEMLQEPHLGYVMELLTGMKPVSTLINPPRNTESLSKWYIEGGGLKRRLRLLAISAEALAQLHGKGLIYSDPSPNNIFVSEDHNAYEVRLIDTDNLHYKSSSAMAAVYTPGYGAPELVCRRSGMNTLTDAHAFAVMAFQTLTLAHPLMGDMVNDGEPELEEKALEGCLPWIDDPDNDSNESGSGIIPREIVLSPLLRELAAKTFGEGLNDPLTRPGISEWAEKLHAAADATLICPFCGWSYYFASKECPNCDQPRPDFVIARFKLWDGKVPVKKPSDKDVILAGVVLAESQPLKITVRLVNGQINEKASRPRIQVHLEGNRIILKSLDGNSYLLTSPNGSQNVKLNSREERIPVEEGYASWQLHLGNPESLHRVVDFEFRPGGQR